VHDWLRTFTDDEFNVPVPGATLQFIDMAGLLELGIKSPLERATIMGAIQAALEAE